MVAHRFAQFNASAHPFIYTPGDGEWTDCYEARGVRGGNPLERLHLRRVFFEGEQSLGQRTIPLIRQSQSSDCILQTYRENVRWTAGGVTFVTLDVPGNNNGLGRAPDGNAEHCPCEAAQVRFVDHL